MTRTNLSVKLETTTILSSIQMAIRLPTLPVQLMRLESWKLVLPIMILQTIMQGISPFMIPMN